MAVKKEKSNSTKIGCEEDGKLEADINFLNRQNFGRLDPVLEGVQKCAKS